MVMIDYGERLAILLFNRLHLKILYNSAPSQFTFSIEITTFFQVKDQKKKIQDLIFFASNNVRISLPINDKIQNRKSPP